MSPHKEKLIALLEELFQLNQPELDFGLYRILHARSSQIKAFVQNELATEIDKVFAGQYQASVHDQLEAARHKIEQTLGDYALEANGELKPEYAKTNIAKEYAALRQQAQQGGGPLADDAQIYDHLYRFFSRYYDKGDFMSRRYFVAENDSRALPYAIPYDGREVMLHWANKDQYYIKSSEYLANFTVDLAAAQKIVGQGGQAGLDFAAPAHSLSAHFRLAAATEGEHNNVKEGQERYFLIHSPEPVKLEQNAQGQAELVIQFQYRPDPEKTGQAGTWQQKRLLEAEAAIQAALATLPEAEAHRAALFTPAPTDKQPKRTLLGKYLGQYTSRNTMDYFIHKNLGGFLRRELDFYIKNEIMRLDDIENAAAPRVESYLNKLKSLRKIARRIIDFLAQIEDFQKKLWLKKKFVVETNYCITLDRIPEAFYPEIAANEAQREEWVRLFAIDEIVETTKQPGYSIPLKIEFLKNNKFLTLDTKNFPDSFKENLFSNISDLDQEVSGVAVNSENFQGLSLVKLKTLTSVKLAYIDPPYNTGDDDFIYKDNYKHSSWSSMQQDRLEIAKELISDSGALVCNLNDIEDWHFRGITENVFGAENYITTVITKCSTASSFRTINPGPVDISDRLLFIAKNKQKYSYTAEYVKKPVDLEHFSRFVTNINQNCSEWKFKPIKLEVLNSLGFSCDSSIAGMKLAREKWGDAANSIIREACEQFAINNAHLVFETKTLQKPAPWIREHIKESVNNKDLVIKIERNNEESIFLLGGRQFYFLSKSVREVDGNKAVIEPVSTIWTDIDTNNLKHEGGVSFPSGKKPLKLLQRIIGMAKAAKGNYVLDYFAGSGSTGHAVINNFRSNKSKEKFFLIEMGAHFDSVLVNRLKRAIYSTGWKNEKPVDRIGISHCFKYLRLESYEDTLNNLLLPHTPAVDLDNPQNAELARDYLLKYWLDFETAGSPSLLNVRQFADPTAYRLKVKQPGSEAQVEKSVDLIETFNWLIGLHVAQLDRPRRYAAELVRALDPELPKDQDTRWVCQRIDETDAGEFWFRWVEGHVLAVPGDETSRQRVLVLWRKLSGDAGRDQAVLDAYLAKKMLNPLESEFETIYINGSHALPSDGNAATRVRLIEETFAQRMWEDA